MTSPKDPLGGIAPKMSLRRFAAHTMTGAEIRAALQGNSISNENKVQYFNPDGTVLYQKGNEKGSGRWGVEGDKFCSDVNPDVRPQLQHQSHRMAVPPRYWCRETYRVHNRPPRILLEDFRGQED